jgi:hypothetical protein
MPERSTKDLREKDARLRNAVKAHVQGCADDEGRTSLDRLIAEVNAAPDQKPIWKEVIVSVAKSLTQSESDWWPALEFLCVMTELKPSKLKAILEEVIATGDCPDPIGRLSIYSLQGELGFPPTAQILVADEELKRALPVQWLDLILPVLPLTHERQRLVAEAIEAGNLTPDHFAQRLDDMRLVGGRLIGNWLSSLRDLFPRDQRSQYDKLVEEIFGINSSEGRAQNEGTSWTQSTAGTDFPAFSISAAKVSYGCADLFQPAPKMTIVNKDPVDLLKLDAVKKLISRIQKNKKQATRWVPQQATG